MSVSSFYSQRRCREQKLLDVGSGKSNREEDEEEDRDCLQQFSRCPACKQERDVVLILPCSHIMCGLCLAAGEGIRSGQLHHRGVARTVCSVLCPECRHPVELPCWNWSSATSCLPQHPTLCPACVTRETDAKREVFQVREPPKHLKILYVTCLHNTHNEMQDVFVEAVHKRLKLASILHKEHF